MSMQTVNSDIQVVIVGGGPCGLSVAAQLGTLRGGTRIAIVEKHSVYQRTHGLKVERASFRNFPQQLRRLVERLWEGSTASSKTLSTSAIEECFKRTLLESGNTQFYYGEEHDIRSLCTKFPNAKIIIGADGSHSLTSKQVFAGV